MLQYIPCPLHQLTGLNCPLCGGQRMVVALWHGQVTEAFWLNPALFIAAPLCAVLWIWRGRPNSRTLLIALTLTLVWGVVRNLLKL